MYLASGDSILGVSTTAAQVDYFITGIDDGGGTVNFKMIASGQLAAVATAIYTPSGVEGGVGSITLYNTGATTQTVALYADPTGASPQVQIARIVLQQNEWATWHKDKGWTLYDAFGAPKTASGIIPSGTSFPSGAQDGDVFYRTDFGTMFFYDGTRTKWLSVDMATYQFARSGTCTVGRDLRFGGNLICGAGSGTHIGFTIPYNVTIVALAGRHDNSPLMQDGYLQVTRGATVICGQGLGAPNNQLYFAAGVQVGSTTAVDADFAKTTLSAQTMQAGWDPTTPAFSNTNDAALAVYCRRHET